MLNSTFVYNIVINNKNCEKGAHFSGGTLPLRYLKHDLVEK